MKNGELKIMRFPLMAAAGVLLLAGLWAGLARLGWELYLPMQDLPLSHGPLMIIGRLFHAACVISFIVPSIVCISYKFMPPAPKGV